MAHEDDVKKAAAGEALTAHRIREEAMRRAQLGGGGSSLEAQMAMLSARVTAEAQERMAAVTGKPSSLPPRR
jgi:hypothetical protein